MSMRFVNLHHHSTFSYMDGFGTSQQHVERAKELGYSAITLTEHGGVSSHFQLEKHALEAGLKPIFGLEAYCGAVDIDNRQQFKNHLTILAKDSNGYRNLNKLVTQSWRDFYYHPTVSGESLVSFSNGLLTLSGCSGSLLACSLLGGKGIPEPVKKYDYGRAESVISRFKAVFGDNYFLEVQPFWELERTCDMNPAYEKLSKETGVPLVVTCDVHYPSPKDSEMQAVLHAAGRGHHTIDDALRSWNYEVMLTLPESDKDLGERLTKTGLSRKAAWEAICNSAYIAEQCNVTLPKAERLRYPISDQDLEPWK